MDNSNQNDTPRLAWSEVGNKSVLLIDDMSIGMKSIKIHDHMSRDTLCFDAILTLNGKQFCKAYDNGSGGPVMIDLLTKDISGYPQVKDNLYAKINGISDRINALNIHTFNKTLNCSYPIDDGLSDVATLLVDCNLRFLLAKKNLQRHMKSHSVFGVTNTADAGSYITGYTCPESEIPKRIETLVEKYKIPLENIFTNQDSAGDHEVVTRFCRAADIDIYPPTLLWGVTASYEEDADTQGMSM